MNRIRQLYRNTFVNCYTDSGEYKRGRYDVLPLLPKNNRKFDLGKDELKDRSHTLYMEILDTIEALDNAFVIEDITAFQDALDRIRLLYIEALFKYGRRVAVKVYSEILQAYLWVVAADKDIHSLRSQGVSGAVYTANEIRKLKSLNKESLREIHRVKETLNTKAMSL
jgi:hypothetical protein